MAKMSTGLKLKGAPKGPALNQTLKDAGYSIFKMPGGKFGIRDPQGGSYNAAGANQQNSLVQALANRPTGGNFAASPSGGGGGYSGGGNNYSMLPSAGGGSSSNGGGTVSIPSGEMPGQGGPMNMPRPTGPGGGMQGGYPGGFAGYDQYPGGAAGGGSRDIYDLATGGTINQFNTAANRLRERVDSATRGNVSAAQNRNLSRGFGASGINDAAVSRENAAGLNAYSQGLSSLADSFEKNRLQGLNVALGAAGLDTQNRQFMDSQLWNILNNRENRDHESAMQSNQNRFTGGENDQNREMQQMLEELQQQNENYRQTQGAGLNSLPQYQPYYPNLNGSINGGIGNGYLNYNSYGQSNGPQFGTSR